MNLIQKLRFKIKSNCKSVFIIGCPRSGTTLAKRYLGTHPDCKIAPYVGLYRPLENEVMRVFKYLSFNKVTVFKQNSWIVDSENWEGNKTAIPFLKKYFPNSYFILVIRNPSATLCSLKETDRHPEVPKDSKYPEWWVELYENALRELEGNRYMMVRYEDLVQKPVQIKQDVCNFLGISTESITEDTSYKLPGSDEPAPDVYEDSKCLNTNTVHTKSLNRRDSEMEITDRLKNFAIKYQYEL